MHVFIPDDDDVWSRALVVDERAGDHPDEGRVFTLQREPLGVHASDPAAKDKVDATKFELTEAQLRGGSLGAGELALQDAGLARGGEGARDMCAALNHLHEAAVLHNLRLRFFAAKPYTYTGDMCIAVNPYRWLDLYRPQTRDHYTQRLVLCPAQEQLAARRRELEPHVYARPRRSLSLARAREKGREGWGERGRG